MSGSTWLMRIALVSFTLSSCSFAAATLIRREEESQVYDFPLPPPGLQAITFGRLAEGGRYEIGVAVASPIESSDPVEASGIPCTIEVTSISGSKQKLLVRSELEATGAYYAGKTRAYSTDIFKMPPGEFELQVRNLGCVDGYVFQGGSATVSHLSSVRIGYAFLPYVVAGLSGIIGLFTLLAMVIGALRRRVRQVNAIDEAA